MERLSYPEHLRRYLSVLRQWAWLLALSTILAGASAYFFSQRVTPAYQASTTLLISQASTGANDEYSSLRARERLARTYSELMTKDPVLQGVIDRLGINYSTEALKNSITVRTISDTQLIVIRAVSHDPQLAAAIANTLAEVFIRQTEDLQAARYAGTKQNLEDQLAGLDGQVRSTGASLDALADTPADKAERDRLETLLAQYRQTYASLVQSYEEVRMAEAQNSSDIVLVEAAKTPGSPFKPDVELTVLMAALAGLLLGGGIALGFEALDDTVRAPDEVLQQLGLPLLGLIANHTTAGKQPVSASEPRAPVVEAFRALRTHIKFSADRPLCSILVTSPSPGEGKSLVAANLAVVLAQGEKRVTLIDGDMRKPTVHKIFGVQNQRGFSNLLELLPYYRDGKMSLKGELQPSGVRNLNLLTSGRLPLNPAEMLASEKTGAAIDLLAGDADMLVLDSPPVLAVTDAAVLAAHVDGVVLVIKPGVTRLGAAREAVEQLRLVGANLIGAVFNDVDLRKASYAYYKFQEYYHSGYSDPPSQVYPPGNNNHRGVRLRGKAR